MNVKEFLRRMNQGEECDDAIIAAGAVVTKDVPAGEVYGGVPAMTYYIFRKIISA